MQDMPKPRELFFTVDGYVVAYAKLLRTNNTLDCTLSYRKARRRASRAETLQRRIRTAEELVAINVDEGVDATFRAVWYCRAKLALAVCWVE